MIGDPTTTALKPYSTYKATSMPWLKKVPETWEACRIKTIFRESQDRRGEKNLELLSLTRAKGLIPQSQSDNATLLAEDLSNYKVCHPSDIVMNRMQAWSGMFAVPRQEGVVSPDYSVFSPTTLGQIRFFEHLFKTPALVEQFAKYSKGIGSGFNRLYSEDFGDVRIPAPPPEEQDAIVQFLDHADEKIKRYIAGKERLIALLEEQRQALVHQAVTRGLDPNVRLKPSSVEWLGDMPEHWEAARFGQNVNIAEGQVDPKIEPYASMLMIAPNHVESGTGRLLSRETAYEQGAISGKYFCRAGDIVYSKIRPGLAKVTVAPSDCLCSADMYPLRPGNSLQSDFLLWLLLSTGFTAWSVLESGRVAMPKINRQTLNNVHIPLPRLSEQVSIIRHLIEATEKVSGAIGRARRQIDLMNEYRTRLIADVVTGQIDVRNS